MAKVEIITEEEADWLDGYDLTQEQIDHFIDIHPYKKRPDSPIFDWSTAKLARALYNGYEVAQSKIEYGHWVIHKNLNKPKAFVVEQMGYDREANEECVYLNDIKIPLSDLRFATKEEINWSKNGRYVWQLKEGDILKHKRTNQVYEVNLLGAYGGSISLRGSGIEGLVAKEEITKSYELVCYAEDREDIRKDVHNGEN